MRRPPGLALVVVMGVTLHAELPANTQPAAPGDVVDRVLAMVEGQVILLSDVRAFQDLRLIEPSDAVDPTAVVLTTLIERELILAEVRDFVEAPSADEVDALLEAVVRRVGGQEAFQERLPVVGYTVGDVRQELRNELLIERYLTRRWGSARPLVESVAARQGLIDDWVASLYARADVRVAR